MNAKQNKKVISNTNNELSSTHSTRFSCGNGVNTPMTPEGRAVTSMLCTNCIHNKIFFGSNERYKLGLGILNPVKILFALEDIFTLVYHGDSFLNLAGLKDSLEFTSNKQFCHCHILKE